jgi:hypothetical protein
VKRDQDVGLSSLYELIAAQLVFKPSARPVHCLALERALNLEIRDPSYGRLRRTPSNQRHEEITGEADTPVTLSVADNDLSDGEHDPAEAVYGHAPFDPDPSRNTPDPGPIPPTPSRPSGASRRSGYSGRSSETSPAPELEREHIETLKRSHYASHCQVCLCKRTPLELAPHGSYVEWEEVRRRVVEAHHVDLKSASGARHAGNLILLCKLHHDNYGRRLTRSGIAEALRSRTIREVVRFDTGSSAVAELNGRKISLVIQDTDETLELFFTDQHADYWLSTSAR